MFVTLLGTLRTTGSGRCSTHVEQQLFLLTSAEGPFCVPREGSSVVWPKNANPTLLAHSKNEFNHICVQRKLPRTYKAFSRAPRPVRLHERSIPQTKKHGTDSLLHARPSRGVFRSSRHDLLPWDALGIVPRSRNAASDGYGCGRARRSLCREGRLAWHGQE
jgi:hypothetical protein